ncbi:MAG: MarR family transcriptional regulator [Kurthia sp.]|nr:MarR family transcriptional regulator [Candidatus Kurthia equi]
MRTKKEIVHQFFQVSRTMTNTLNHRLAVYDLTHAQLAVIEYLASKSSSVSLVDIATYLHVEKSTVTRTVRILEKAGFIEQVASEDSREKRMILSDKTVQMQEEIQLTKNQFEEDLFQSISKDDLTVTYQTLLKLMKNLNGDDLQQHE